LSSEAPRASKEVKRDYKENIHAVKVALYYLIDNRKRLRERTNDSENLPSRGCGGKLTPGIAG